MKNNRLSLIDIRRIAIIGVLAAFSVVLVMYIHVPFFFLPEVSFLEYDPADIPIYITTFFYGPFSGLLITVVVSVVQGLTVSAKSGVYGILMHIISTGTFVLISGFIYRLRKNYTFLLISLAAGIAATVAIMIPANLTITPLFNGWPVESVVAVLPGIIIFNLLKQCINAAITAILFVPLSKAVKKFL